MKARVWTETEKEYIEKSIGHVPIDDIAEFVGRTPRAVKQYIHRCRIGYGRTIKNNIVKELLLLRFRDLDCFRPTRKFYDEIHMTSHQWWDVYFARRQVTHEEYISISRYFGIEREEILDARQLKLFDDDNRPADN